MRLSGTYFDRLLFNVLPWTIFGGIVIYSTKRDNNIFVLIYAMAITTAALWTIDTIIIYTKFKKPKSLRIDNGELLLGDEEINSKDIEEITSLTDNRLKWSFKMLQLRLKDGRIFMVIDKPQTFIADLWNKNSKTLTKIVDEYPELKTKIRAQKNI